MTNKQLNINEDFWRTLDQWLSEEVDKETLSELFLTVGTQLQKDINGKDFGVARALDYVKRVKQAITSLILSILKVVMIRVYHA